jgi:hypothetical protein
VRNPPAVFAGSAFHPPITPAHAVSNLQDEPEQSGIGRVAVLALETAGPALFRSNHAVTHDAEPGAIRPWKVSDGSDGSGWSC